MPRPKGSRTGHAKVAIISSASGSSVFWQRAHRSREPRENSLSTITACVAIGNHVSAEAQAGYIVGAGATKDQLEEIVADESLGLIDHYRIVRGGLYKGFSAASELGDGNSLALLAARLHENFRDCGRLTGELQRGPLLNIQNNVLVNPDYTRALARIVAAVAPYPEAREAVIAALRDLDASSCSPPALVDRSAGALVDG